MKAATEQIRIYTYYEPKRQGSRLVILLSLTPDLAGRIDFAGRAALRALLTDAERKNVKPLANPGNHAGDVRRFISIRPVRRTAYAQVSPCLAVLLATPLLLSQVKAPAPETIAVAGTDPLTQIALQSQELTGRLAESRVACPRTPSRLPSTTIFASRKSSFKTS